MAHPLGDLAVTLFGELLMADQLARTRISRALPKGMELSHFSVLNHLSGEKRRPLCDTVHAMTPPEVAFTIQGSLTFYATADRALAMQQAQAAADAWAAERRAGLGRDIVPEQLTAVLQVAGVYRAALTLPVLTAVQSHQWANCTGIVLTDAGVVDG